MQAPRFTSACDTLLIGNPRNRISRFCFFVFKNQKPYTKIVKSTCLEPKASVLGRAAPPATYLKTQNGQHWISGYLGYGVTRFPTKTTKHCLRHHRYTSTSVCRAPPVPSELSPRAIVYKKNALKPKKRNLNQRFRRDLRSGIEKKGVRRNVAYGM
jgi:hypothetical protein